MKKLFAAVLAVAFAVAFGVAADPVPNKKPEVKQLLTEDQKTLPTKENVPQYLQDISVTIKANRAEGSGVITNVNGVNYVWTAAHVVSRLRNTRVVVGNDGSPKVVVEFDDAEVVKELIEDGRTVGEMKFTAEVIRYSDAEFGEDLALLRVRKKNLSKHHVHFYLEKDAEGKLKIPTLGTELFHVGSLLGQSGSNSMTSGLYSQVGRIHNGVVYDQTTCAAFPGSSGGGVYLKDGRYVGMIVRGAGETFNLIVPNRRLHGWAKKVGVDFTLDPSLPVPDEATLKTHPIENSPRGGSSSSATAVKAKLDFKFLVYLNEK
jgi:S1-C subfamily serine protease